MAIEVLRGELGDSPIAPITELYFPPVDKRHGGDPRHDRAIYAGALIVHSILAKRHESQYTEKLRSFTEQMRTVYGNGKASQATFYINEQRERLLPSIFKARWYTSLASKAGNGIAALRPQDTGLIRERPGNVVLAIIDGLKGMRRQDMQDVVARFRPDGRIPPPDDVFTNITMPPDLSRSRLVEVKVEPPIPFEPPGARSASR